MRAVHHTKASIAGQTREVMQDAVFAIPRFLGRLFERVRRHVPWYIVPIAAVLLGAIRPVSLIHDVFSWQASWYDNALHVLSDFSFPISLLYLACVIALIRMMARAVDVVPVRAAWLAAIWTCVGIGAAGIAGQHLDLLQDTYNGATYKRFTPDDYLYWLGAIEWSDPSVYLVVSRGDPERYTWSRLIYKENLWFAVMSVAAAATLFRHRSNASKASLRVPLVLILLILIYTVIYAPWSATISYDDFVGDRVLGAVAMSWFLMGSWDESGGTVGYVYVVSMAILATYWRMRDGPRPVPKA